jgi:hypothetical protein
MATFRPATENAGRLDYTGRCLHATTDEPVGDPITATDIEVRSDASFDAPLVGELPHECNSVTFGMIQANGLLHGNLRSADFVCGEMTGDAGGLPLQGTTFAVSRIVEGVLPEPAWRCDQAPPAP